MTNKQQIYRVLDANLNRLREALRVVEEYYRFIDERPAVCVALKKTRHDVAAIGRALGRRALLGNRDTASDCFAGRSRPEERDRAGLDGLLEANFKRGQEACRVIEEYAKPVAAAALSEKAKKARFSLYHLEKELLSGKREGRRRGKGAARA